MASFKNLRRVAVLAVVMSGPLLAACSSNTTTASPPPPAPTYTQPAPSAAPVVRG
jgi:hypothetical protein